MRPRMIKHTCYPFKPKKQGNKTMKGEGCPSPMQDFKPPFLSLKINWFLMVKRPTHPNKQGLTKEAQKGAK